MCTVTWLRTAGGYELFFNRDELRTRATASPPTAAVTAGVRYLAPTDNEAGGSWLAVNEHGTTIGLLNAHPATARAPSRVVSRGLLVRRLADLADPRRLRERIRDLELDRLQPFTIFAASPGEAAVLDWDGRALEARDPGSPFLLSSSSRDSGGAESARRRALGRLLRDAPPSAAAHLAFHRSHLPARGPLSPCMHRDDARTVSMTRIVVTDAAVATAYAAGPPCRSPLSSTAQLPRAAPDEAGGRPAG